MPETAGTNHFGGKVWALSAALRRRRVPVQAIRRSAGPIVDLSPNTRGNCTVDAMHIAKTITVTVMPQTRVIASPSIIAAAGRIDAAHDGGGADPGIREKAARRLSGRRSIAFRRCARIADHAAAPGVDEVFGLVCAHCGKG